MVQRARAAEEVPALGVEGRARSTEWDLLGVAGRAGVAGVRRGEGKRRPEEDDDDEDEDDEEE